MKVGQHIGSLDYLFPPEYVSTFRLFHSEAPQTPLYRLKKVIEEEMERPGTRTCLLYSLFIISNLLNFFLVKVVSRFS